MPCLQLHHTPSSVHLSHTVNLMPLKGVFHCLLFQPESRGRELGSCDVLHRALYWRLHVTTIESMGYLLQSGLIDNEKHSIDLLERVMQNVRRL